MKIHPHSLKRFRYLALFLALATFSAAGCVRSQAGTSAGGAVADNSAEAEALLQSACSTCHDLGVLSPYQEGAFTAAQFRETVNRMVGYGAFVNPAQVNLLVDYVVPSGD